MFCIPRLSTIMREGNVSASREAFFSYQSMSLTSMLVGRLISDLESASHEDLKVDWTGRHPEATHRSTPVPGLVMSGGRLRFNLGSSELLYRYYLVTLACHCFTDHS